MDQGGNYWTLFTPGIWKVLHAVLQAELATILALASTPAEKVESALAPLSANKQSRGEPLFSAVQLSVVAGIGFEPMTFRL